MEDTFDAYEVIKSPQFQTSSLQLECDPLVNSVTIAGALDVLGATYAEYHAAHTAYETAYDACMEQFGHVDWKHPLFVPISDRSSKAGKPYDDALQKLDDYLTADVLCCIVEAVKLVGVTDRITALEAARCVIRGGEMWDGKGFTKGQSIETVITEPEPIEPGTRTEPSPVPASDACPDCGSPTDPNSVRCPVCRRFL